MIDSQSPPRSVPEAEPWHSFQAEHATLSIHVEHLEARLGPDPGAGTAPAGVDELLSSLEAFREQLLAHLSAEEQDGLLERAVEEAPHFDHRARGLRGEHDVLRELLETLVGEAAAGRWQRVRVGFAEFCETLRDHEAAENELMQRAYLEDVGAGD